MNDFSLTEAVEIPVLALNCHDEAGVVFALELMADQIGLEVTEHLAKSIAYERRVGSARLATEFCAQALVA